MPDSSRPTDAGISIFSTLEAFKGGLGALSLSSAATVCRGWVAKLDEADRPELRGIRDLLKQLGDELAGDRAEGPPDGASIGDLMKRLGAHTAEVAPTIGQDHLVAPLGRLGTYLSAAGTALAGGARPTRSRASRPTPARRPGTRSSARSTSPPTCPTRPSTRTAPAPRATTSSSSATSPRRRATRRRAPSSTRSSPGRVPVSRGRLTMPDARAMP